MTKAERPRFDEDHVQSMIDCDAAAPAGETPPTPRARWLQAWKEALQRRDELRQRLEEADRARLTGEPPAQSPLPAASRAPGIMLAPDLAELPVRLIHLRGVQDDLEPLDVEKLATAREVAAVGSHVPEFPERGRFSRLVSRLAARVVLFFAGIVTVHQRIVNSALLDFAGESAAEINRLRARITGVADNVQRLAEAITRVHETLRALQAELRAEAVTRATQAQTSESRLLQRLTQHERQMVEMELRLADADCDRAWLRLAEAEYREELDAVQSELESLRGPAMARLTADDDSLYAELEDVFRGSHELVKQRLSAYLPVLSRNGLGSADRPILDLGCGRGEWLELLGERSLVGRGVDSNDVLVGACRTRGLDAVAGDALAYLRGQPANHWGMVSALHVVEHLPFDDMVALLDESLRVLKPGGVLLLETPNPENLVVSATSFLCDPTHLRPVHPDLLEFLTRHRGFVGIDVMRLTALRADERLAELDPGDPLAARLNPIVQLVNRHLAAPADFAVIAQKPV